MRQNTVEISIAAPLPYLLITGQAIDLGKVSVSDMQNLKTVSNTLSADGKYSLLKRDNLMQHIQMQLSRKEKLFSNFFSIFLKSTLNFEHFLQKGDPHCRCIADITDRERNFSGSVISEIHLD